MEKCEKTCKSDCTYLRVKPARAVHEFVIESLSNMGHLRHCSKEHRTLTKKLIGKETYKEI